MLSQPLEETTVRGGPVRRTVLIVEDDESLADVLSIRLTGQGYDAVVAETGKRGLALARADQPSVILLDLGLPDMNGYAVCEELVDDPQTSEIPVIVVSGTDQPDVLRRARAAGCQYFLHKPYDPNALLVLIRQAIDEAA